MFFNSYEPGIIGKIISKQLNNTTMKTVKLLKIAFVFAAIISLGACEEEEITVKNTTGDPQVVTIDGD